MMRLKKLIMLVLGLCLFSPCLGQAETLRAVTIALEPYGIKQNSGHAGIAHEVVKAIVKEAGFSFKSVLGPLSRGVEDVSSGEADLILMLPNGEVGEYAEDLGPVFEVENIVISRPKTVLRSIDSLKGKKVAQVRAARYDPRISRENLIRVYVTENYEQSLKMLMADRVEFVVGPNLGLLWTAKEMRLPPKAFGTPLVLSTNHAHLFLSKKSATPEIRQALIDALRRLEEKGVLKEILRKYSL